MRWVLASNNRKKLAEMQSLLAGLGVSLLPQGELGIPEAEEPFGTFLENALAKARHAARCSGLPAVADDSGLCVDALQGAPGVRSARYGMDFGRPKTDADNNAALLEALAHTDPALGRQGRYVCALVALRSPEDPEPLVAMGRWAGHIVSTPQGQGGFGYDPLMWIPELGCTVAELDPARKNTFSHRGRAMAALVAQMRQVWGLAETASPGR